MTRRGHVPTRMCIGCHGRKSKEELLRLVLGSDGSVELGDSKKAFGRGIYLCPDEACLKKAQKKKRLARGVSVGPSDVFWDRLLPLWWRGVEKRRKGNGES